MPFVKIEQDCRVLGQGFSPGEKSVEVNDVVAAALVKEKLGVVVEAPVVPGDGGGSGEKGGSGAGGTGDDKTGNEND